LQNPWNVVFVPKVYSTKESSPLKVTSEVCG
jgi:hypothetical protein